MNKWHRHRDRKKFIVIFYEQSLIFERFFIISINMNQSNNCCLYSFENEDLIRMKSP